MKMMSRDFSTSEKILLLVLALILIGLAYYYFVDTPVRQAINASEIEAATLQSELTAVEQRLAYLSGIRKNLDDLSESEKRAWMGSYNNSKAEVKYLNDVLANTMRYSIAFANVTRKGDQIRRNFTLQFQTTGFPAAQEIITQLIEGENRCLVGDMNCSMDPSGTVTINATATFFETMVGGIPDAGLPSDSATANR